MKVYLLAAIFLIACPTTREGSDTTTQASDSSTPRLSSGEAIAIVQESLRTKEPPRTRATRAASLETCWGYVVAYAQNWTAALNLITVASSRSPGGREFTGQSYWRVVASRPPSSGAFSGGVEWVWHLYPSSLVETVEAPC